MKKHLGISITYPSYFPDEFEKEFIDDLRHENLNLVIRKEEPRVWGSLEWMIPGLIAIYILKPYFTSFLSEAGKSHFNTLNKSLNKLLNLSKIAKVSTLSSDNSTKKLDINNTQSKAISIHIETSNGKRIKLLFDNDLSLESWESALRLVLEKTYNDYLGNENEGLNISLKDISEDSKDEIIAVISSETKDWTFYSISEIVRLSRIKKDSKS